MEQGCQWCGHGSPGSPCSGGTSVTSDVINQGAPPKTLHFDLCPCVHHKKPMGPGPLSDPTERNLYPGGGWQPCGMRHVFSHPCWEAPYPVNISLHLTFPGALCACCAHSVDCAHTSSLHPLPMFLDPRAFPTWEICSWYIIDSLAPYTR